MNIHKHSLTYSVSAAILVIAFSLGIYFAGFRNSAWNYLSYVFYIGIIVFGALNWRKNGKDGFMSYGQAMGYTTFFALYYSIIMAIWAYVFMSYIMDPAIMDAEFAKQAAKMREQGLPEESIKMGIDFGKKFASPPVMAVLALFGGMFFLTIFNLIISAFVKKDKPEVFGTPEQQQQFPPLG
ncbi:MAG: DUF4199 domain-containing protein [Bacteroidetes bacterium]|nr:DUF4199 domain-containing protein [Bacteroidota bacterium]